MNRIEINIDENKNQKKQKTRFGIFIEDLSHALDGGIYGELLQNRSFEYEEEDHEGYHSMTAWECVERGDSFAQIHTETVKPRHPDNPHYLVIEALAVDKGCGIQNLGYNHGICIRKKEQYRFYCFCRVVRGGNVTLEVRLEDESGCKEYACEKITLDSARWTKYECILTASDTDPNGRLTLLLKSPSIIHIDMVSLFPVDTFCGRENGLRKDLAEMLADLKPAFIRFPGGCLTHVGTLDYREKSSMYRWKNTLGPVDERPVKRNVLWKYNQTLGMGFYEFFLLCEDLGAEPFPVVSAGHDPHFIRTAGVDEIQEWIDEALDLIEFANGGINTPWGRVRADMGHPESFRLKYLTIGNEEVGEGYTRNYDIIAEAVRKKYPEIKLINSTIVGKYDGKPESDMAQALRTKTEYIDVHSYGEPEWFLANAYKFVGGKDMPEVFFGEYSSRDDTLYNALVEAAFMIGAENTDGIAFMCYAPLLNNVAYSNWKPDLIHYDNYRCYGIPSYHVQRMFTHNQGELLISVRDSMKHEENTVPCNLTGYLTMKVDLAEIEIKDFTILSDKKTVKIPKENFSLSSSEKERCWDERLEEDFTVTFTFRRKKAPGTPAYRGKYALTLSLEDEGKKSGVTWLIDGWQRLTSLSGRIGKSKTHHLVEIQSGREYHAMLRVEKDRASAYIDGILCNTFENLSVIPEELYYSAQKDYNGDIIVKAVNIHPENKELSICLNAHADYSVLISSIEGYEPDARNSLEEPENVTFKQKESQTKGGIFTYEMQGYSFLVFRFRTMT